MYNAVWTLAMLATGVAGSADDSDLCRTGRGFGNEAVIRYILQDYQKLSRPAVGMEEVDVWLRAGLMSIDGLVEQHEQFSFTAWLTFTWHDPRLAWAPGSRVEVDSNGTGCVSPSPCQDDLDLGIANVTSLILPQSVIWTPTILVSNSVTGFQDLAGSDFEAGQVVIERDGKVTWIIGDRFDVRCSINTHKFPFDEQVCFAELTTDTVLYGQVRLHLNTTEVNCSAIRPNAEYELTATRLARETYLGWRRAVRLKVSISRRWLQYVFQAVLPILLISLLNTSVFLLPPDCGERVSFSVALLLSYVIFMSSVSSTLPPNSLTVCLYSLYLAALTLLSTVSAAANVVIIACHKHRRHGQVSVSEVIPFPPDLSMAPSTTTELCWKRAPGLRKSHDGDDDGETTTNRAGDPDKSQEHAAFRAMYSNFCHASDEISTDTSHDAGAPCPLSPAAREARLPSRKEKISTWAFGVSLAVTVCIHTVFLGLLVA